MQNILLRMTDITKTFPGATVLNKAYLEVNKGEIMGIVGENGAGKSTLLKILTGVYERTGGEIEFKGKNVRYNTIDDSQKDGIAFMHQELNVFENMTVVENLFLNRKEYSNKIGFIEKKKMEQDARKLFDDLGVDIDIYAMGGELSVHEQQIVEIAKAMSRKAELIIMDEPTAALPENEVQRFFSFIRKLNASGVTIIYVSHKMVEIKQICDRVTILRNGETVDVVNMADTEVEELINKMVGRSLDDYYIHTPSATSETVLKVEKLCGEGFRNVSFQLKKSEVLGIYGLAGSGTLELAECLFGNEKPYSGKLFINGKEKKITSIFDMVKNRIAYVPMDRKTQGFVRGMSIFDNIIMAPAGKKKRWIFVDWKNNEIICNDFKERLSIKATSLKQHVDTLSGGNQQKVVISKWLATNPEILILNEPTRGVDVGAKAEIYSLIDQLVKQNLSIILISSEAPEVLGMCDRVLIMHKGQLAVELGAEQLQQDLLLTYASGREDSHNGK